jgi:hypothetical protein
MGEFIYSHFEIQGDISSCLETAPIPSQDPCKIEVTVPDQAVDETSTQDSFVLERKGTQFTPAAKDAKKITSRYPDFRVPAQELSDFIKVKRVFFEIFGTFDQPTSTAKNIRFPSREQEPLKILFWCLENITNFISHGRLESENPSMRGLLEAVVLAGIFIFVDPAGGNLTIGKLEDLKGSSDLSPAARKRVQWLLGINQARNKLWTAMKPETEKSQALETQLRRSTSDLLGFLFANHLMAEQGYKNTIYSKNIRESAQAYHDIKKDLDKEKYDPSRNYYAYIASILPQLRGIPLDEQFRTDFTQRLNFLIEQYRTEARKETERLMNQDSPVNAIRTSLRLNYGDTRMRREALDIILSHVQIQVKEGQPTFLVPMIKISVDLKKWAAGQATPAKRAEAAATIAYQLRQLFERGEKIKIYWKQKWVEVPSFYYSESIPLVGTNKSYLEELIVWSRQEAEAGGAELPPEARPRTGFRKYTALAEGGSSALFLGSTLIPYSDPKVRYYARGAGLTAGCAAAGALAGNGLSYVFDVQKGAWILDVTGAIVAGSACATVYGLTVDKPGDAPRTPGTPPPDEGGQRNPVDPYGP